MLVPAAPRGPDFNTMVRVRIRLYIRYYIRSSSIEVQSRALLHQNRDMASVLSTADPIADMGGISMRDGLCFGLALIFQFPLILISCLIRRWGIDNELDLRTDLFRSLFRT